MKEESHMLFQVEMTVKLPPDMPDEQAAKIKATEKAYSQDLLKAIPGREAPVAATA
jgi:muconolactone delta-isomerase